MDAVAWAGSNGISTSIRRSSNCQIATTPQFKSGSQFVYQSL